MKIDEALAGVELRGRTDSSVEVTGIRYDSRRVKPGDIFVAMCGGATDGNRFVPGALERGAVAILTDSREVWEQRPQAEVPFYLVENGRRALAGIAANLLGHPERKLRISAVTGTNGKTTTAWLLEQMLRGWGRKCVLIGTIETHVGDEVRTSEHTTPEASDLLQIFADGVAAGCAEAVMEISSHALDQERVWGVPLEVAIFTNLTQDHLDYHGTMEAYAAAKAKMFAGVGTRPPMVAVVNADDPFTNRMRPALERCRTVWTYGIQSSAMSSPTPDFLASDVRLWPGQTSFRLQTPAGEFEVQSQLSGRVHVYNLVAAIAAGLALGMTTDDVRQALGGLRSVPGRFQTIPNQLGITVVVDYAHTEDALSQLIALARELVVDRRVITVFGCGGDRDKTKRAKMGKAAGQGSDLVVLTSDNPRSEDPSSILDQVLVGVLETGARYIVEVDRRRGIQAAVEASRPGDIVLIAGKGHEKVQVLKDRAIAFDDAEIAARILEEVGRVAGS